MTATQTTSEKIPLDENDIPTLVAEDPDAQQILRMWRLSSGATSTMTNWLCGLTPSHLNAESPTLDLIKAWGKVVYRVAQHAAEELSEQVEDETQRERIRRDLLVDILDEITNEAARQRELEKGIVP